MFTGYGRPYHYDEQHISLPRAGQKSLEPASKSHHGQQLSLYKGSIISDVLGSLAVRF